MDFGIFNHFAWRLASALYQQMVFSAQQRITATIEDPPLNYTGRMETLGIALVFIVALEHLYFLYLEMFLWTRPRGLKIFGNTRASAEASKVLAANQGLYNGFLAAGLLWGLVHPSTGTGLQIQVFFLICILIAAVFGGITVKRRILFIQGIPALLALTVQSALHPFG